MAAERFSPHFPGGLLSEADFFLVFFFLLSLTLFGDLTLLDL